MGAPSSNILHALVGHGPVFQEFPAETNRNKLYVNKQDPKEIGYWLYLMGLRVGWRSREDFMETWGPREEQEFGTLQFGVLGSLAQGKFSGTWGLVLFCHLAILKVITINIHLPYEPISDSTPKYKPKRNECLCPQVSV